MQTRVTMADVAREAGVSLMTVSRVLNNKEGVASETREHILEIIERLGYRPSGIARSLVTQQTGTIGLVVPDISNPYFSGIAHGVSEIAYAEGLSVLLCNSEEDPERELDFLSVLLEKQVDGLLIAAPRQQTEKLVPFLRQYNYVVVINRLIEDAFALSASGFVINDDQQGGYLATRHLIDTGHRAIGFLAGPTTSFGSRRRKLGYEAALEEAGLPFLPEYSLHCPPTVQGGCDAAVALLTAHPEVTALFCFNDLAAIGALQGGVLVGRDVPRDLAIVGYDDIPMASWVTPALTTLRAPVEEMGRLSTRLLVERMRGCSDDCGSTVLTPELVIRASAPATPHIP